MKLIELHGGQQAIVDDDDFDDLIQFRWHLTDDGYAGAKPGKYKPYILMHRRLLNPPAGFVSDHINGNRLDNRRANLRVATRAGNSWNSRARNQKYSVYKGVSWNKELGKWRARIVCDGHEVWSRHFNYERKAAWAYNQAALKYHGEFARLNVIGELSPEEMANDLYRRGGRKKQ